MVRIQFAIDLQYELSYPGADFVFNIHAAQTKSQSILSEQLHISQPVLSDIQTDPATLARDLKQLSAKYVITCITPVDMFPHTSSIETVVLLSKLS